MAQHIVRHLEVRGPHKSANPDFGLFGRPIFAPEEPVHEGVGRIAGEHPVLGEPESATDSYSQKEDRQVWQDLGESLGRRR